jgi:acyl-CoA thioesterase FadM
MPSIDCGKELYAEPAGPVKTSSLLQEQIFETTLEDANLVGNIYFSNYYLWQGRVRDNFLNKIAPEFFSGSGEKGELRCINCKVNHMSEAMPFDRIAVRMHRSAVFKRGLNFYFDCYRITADGKRHKLGYGEHEAVWFAPNKEGKWVSAELPLALRSAIVPKDKPINSSYTPLRQSGKNDKYDVIIVGSGIGGLTAGALLTKRGRRVLVVEQHDKPGGFCTSWERFIKHKNKKLRFVFDAGVHDISDLSASARTWYRRSYRMASNGPRVCFQGFPN